MLARKVVVIVMLIQIGLLGVACSDNADNCGTNSCGACPPGCASVSKCTSSGWDCACECPDGGALDGGGPDGQGADGSGLDGQGLDGGADTAPDGGSKPGNCFEVFATRSPGNPGTILSGISHTPPRKDDLGQVALGDTVTITVRFFNFCGDQQSVVVGTQFLQSSPAFSTVQKPTVGAKVSTNDLVIVEYTPTQIGKHLAEVRYEVTHGYYDFTLTGEGIAP